MAEPSDAPTFRSLSDALARLEGLLRSLSTLQMDEPLRAEVHACGKGLDHLVAALHSFYVERAEPHLLPRGAQDRSFAMVEIEKTPLPRQDRGDPVFIVGHWRSGTTLLSWLLDSHPSFAAVPENMLLTSLCGAGAVSREPFRAQLHPLVWAYQSVQFLGEERMRYFSRYGDLVDGVFTDFATRRGKRRWVAKELLLHRSLDLLDLLFGYRCRFVFIHRHGLDVALSASERFGARDGAPQEGPTSFDLETYLGYWVAQNGPCMDFHERNPERCLRLRYEDFVQDPAAEGRRLFAFLGEAWPETILEDMQRQEHPEGLGDNKIHETGGRIDPQRRDRWRGLPFAVRRQMGRRANPLLERLGYAPVEG